MSPSRGGKGGKQLLFFAEHQRISHTGVSQGGAGSTDSEEVIAQDHRSSYWHSRSLRERLIYAWRKSQVKTEAPWRLNRPKKGCTTSLAPLTCTSDISNHIKSILIDTSGQRKCNDGPTVFLVVHRQYQSSQPRHWEAPKFHKRSLLAVISPMATSYFTDDHVFRCQRGAGADVLPQWGGRSNL